MVGEDDELLQRGVVADGDWGFVEDGVDGVLRVEFVGGGAGALVSMKLRAGRRNSPWVMVRRRVVGRDACGRDACGRDAYTP